MELLALAEYLITLYNVEDGRKIEKLHWKQKVLND